MSKPRKQRLIWQENKVLTLITGTAKTSQEITDDLNELSYEGYSNWSKYDVLKIMYRLRKYKKVDYQWIEVNHRPVKLYTRKLDENL